MSARLDRALPRFQTPHPGDEVVLWLRSELFDELRPQGAAERVRELLAKGVDRLRVRVVKVPWGDVLGADDAVKVEAPELACGPSETAIYVRLAYLELPTI